MTLRPFERLVLPCLGLKNVPFLNVRSRTSRFSGQSSTFSILLPVSAVTSTFVIL